MKKKMDHTNLPTPKADFLTCPFGDVTNLLLSTSSNALLWASRSLSIPSCLWYSFSFSFILRSQSLHLSSYQVVCLLPPCLTIFSYLPCSSCNSVYNSKIRWCCISRTSLSLLFLRTMFLQRATSFRLWLCMVLSCSISCFRSLFCLRRAWFWFFRAWASIWESSGSDCM